MFNDKMIIFAGIAFILIFSVGGHKTFFFQSDNIPNTDDYALHILEPVRNLTFLTELTMSFWMKIYYFRPSTYVFSYATSDANNNELNFKMDPTYLTMGFSATYYTVYLPKGVYHSGEWYHIAILYSDISDTFDYYVNGKFLKSFKSRNKKIEFHGSLVLGQETDSFSGGFVKEQSFSGWLTSMNIFSRQITPDEIAKLSNCSSDPLELEGDVLAWSKTKWTLHGNVLEDDAYDVCNPQNITDVPVRIIREKFGYEEALLTCKRIFSSDIYVPRNEEENSALYDIASPIADSCRSKYHAAGFLWMGATDEVENRVYRDSKGVLLNYTKFYSGSGKNRQQSCAAMLTGRNARYWDDISCKKNIFCSACYNTYPLLNIRGICEELDIGRLFTVQDNGDGKFTFRGFTRYNIYTENNQTWFLEDMWKNSTILASYFNHNEVYPVGIRKWRILHNYTICGLPAGDIKSISLSSCSDNEFTCKNGDCINLDKRCDLSVDCSDNSDEIGCTKLNKPDTYLSSLFPTAEDKTKSLLINMSTTIEKLSNIDVMNMKLDVDITIKLSWFDRRLTYSNLQPENDLNMIEHTSVWTPKVDYVNAEFQSISSATPTLSVKRMSDPEPDDASRTLRDNIYAGHQNGLQLEKTIHAVFNCKMALYYFPFDTQLCYVELRLSSARSSIMHFDEVLSSYKGEVLLTEYEVGQISAKQYQDLMTFSTVKLYIPLHRRYSFYITTTYLPSFMLMVISYISLFCKLENADLRVMMTITTLLVLYSLYQQISVSLPKTAYIKAVDIWCFFALTIIFTQVVFHVFLELDVFNGKEKNGMGGELFNPIKSNTDAKMKWCRWMRWLYMIVFGLFFAIYCSIIAINIYSINYQ